MLRLNGYSFSTVMIHSYDTLELRPIQFYLHSPTDISLDILIVAHFYCQTIAMVHTRGSASNSRTFEGF